MEQSAPSRSQISAPPPTQSTEPVLLMDVPPLSSIPWYMKPNVPDEETYHKYLQGIYDYHPLALEGFLTAARNHVPRPGIPTFRNELLVERKDSVQGREEEVPKEGENEQQSVTKETAADESMVGQPTLRRSTRQSVLESQNQEQRERKERQRKGKQVQPSSPRREVSKKPRQDNAREGTEGSQAIERIGEPQSERISITLSNKLLSAMSTFTERRLKDVYKSRVSAAKQISLGRKLHRQSLRELGIEAEFFRHIKAIGFDWLLEIEENEIPIDLVHEFFTSFRFDPANNLEAKSIKFRVFNKEMDLSLNEWSLYLGIYSKADISRGLWREMDIGFPHENPQFNAQKAWEELTHEDLGSFKTSVSRGFHIKDHALRFAQAYIGHNLHGQTSVATITQADLYMMWCMHTFTKVHLGFWLANCCSQIAHHPARKLNACHILSSFVKRNIEIIQKPNMAVMAMTPPPMMFDMKYFLNTYLARPTGSTNSLYIVGLSDKNAGKVPEVEGTKEASVSQPTALSELKEMLMQAMKEQNEVNLR